MIKQGGKMKNAAEPVFTADYGWAAIIYLVESFVCKEPLSSQIDRRDERLSHATGPKKKTFQID